MREADIIEHLRQQLPVAFGRTEVEKLLPGITSSKTLANLSSCGEGPPFYYHGRKVFYEKEGFLSWLSKRIKPGHN